MSTRTASTAPEVERPKSGAERIALLRANRDAAGLKRLELYAHPDDWMRIKAYAAKMQRKRDRAAA